MDLGDLVPLAITFVVVGLVIGFGLNILSEVRGDFVTGASGCNATTTVACGFDFNASQKAIDANANVADKLPLLGLVVAAAIIIGVLLKAFQD